jgi:hypothetical protein
MAPRLWNAWTRPLAAFASLALLGLALPASAEDMQVAATAADTTDVGGQVTAPIEEYVKQGQTPEESAAWWSDFWKGTVEWSKATGNRYMVGTNSLITFPADPVMDTVKPREEFEELPLADFGPKYVAGLGTGVMLGIYRASTGVFDVVFAPLTPMKMLSPEPRYTLLPGEHPEF